MRFISLVLSPAEAGHLQPAHHAGPGKHSVVHRVGLDVAATTDEIHLDHDQVVDMLKVVSESSLSEARVAAADHQVACGPCTNLASDMSRQDELAIVPADVDLHTVSVWPDHQ